MARSLVPLVFDAGFPASRADPFLTLHREMNRLFDDAMHGASRAGTASGVAPRMNVSETEQDIRVEVELPGVSERDVQVDLTDDLLTVRGEKRAAHEDAQHHVVERSFGSFARSVRLPFSPDPDRVQASFADGVLTITLPKSAAQARVRRIQVRPGSGTNGGSDRGAARSMNSQNTAAAVAGHPTPDTTRSGGGQGGSGQGDSGQGGAGQANTGSGAAGPDDQELNDQGRVKDHPVLDNPGAGHPT